MYRIVDQRVTVETTKASDRVVRVVTDTTASKDVI